MAEGIIIKQSESLNFADTLQQMNAPKSANDSLRGRLTILGSEPWDTPEHTRYVWTPCALDTLQRSMIAKPFPVNGGKKQRTSSRYGFNLQIGS